MTQTFSPTLFPFESRFLPIDGHVVHYIDEGDGPTLLFFHGNPTSSFLYRDSVLGLRGRFRCVAFDYPGFGLSAARKGYDYKPSSHARVATEFIDRLGIASFSLMVQDWGGPIGLAVAVQRPEAVRGVVIGNSWAWPVATAGSSWKARPASSVWRSTPTSKPARAAHSKARPKTSMRAWTFSGTTVQRHLALGTPG